MIFKVISQSFLKQPYMIGLCNADDVFLFGWSSIFYFRLGAFQASTGSV
jgi:hypothetical protein